MDFAVITSAYSKNALQQYLNENSILYINPDKKRTNSWLSLNRLQLPLGENRYGSIRKISYANGEVKIQNSKNMSPLERALKNAGVVDEFGNTQFSVRDILPDERDLLMAEASKRGASRELKRYRAKYREIERLNERAEYYKEEMQLIEDGRQKASGDFATSIMAGPGLKTRARP